MTNRRRRLSPRHGERSRTQGWPSKLGYPDFVIDDEVQALPVVGLPRLHCIRAVLQKPPTS
ncbi:hypothetical protein XACG117_2840011 [Xanthomonas citri pv. citri]|nr:hypothetical protein XACG117_2840011 [Xanthomonas citri pv. citri]